ncbi:MULTISPECIES: LysR family transcriptional regulator [Pacificibacter]|uniref:LysR family transcriptional regulator n=1 Tax=Pacificibacter TaxID=1042323 RepID=UPI001C0951D3|nr:MULTISPECIES: LysR family transcriptional regulator [Pacificibacter]MBU2937760.1 LysR family transcriptional regulator [Pacificibacter marinus]MDO6616021.1 LysR family transcriptional regulator [Pacificibacter sp. 1_MG-2023]
MLDKLEMFVALAREGHFSRAAESLNIAQPTLSGGIKQLEEHLGVQLVHRGSRYGGLTPEGQSALTWAKRILRDTKQLRDEMRMGNKGLSGEVRIAVIPTAQTWAARLCSAFSAKHPNVRFTLLSRTSREILQMLDDFEIDAGISYLDNEPLGKVDTAPLYEESYTVVCARSSPFAQNASVKWSDLSDAPLALLTPDMQNRRIIDQLFAQNDATQRTCIESNSTIALVANVASGQCVTILPKDIAEFLSIGKNLALVHLEGTVPKHSVGLVLPHREPRTPVLAALLNEAKNLTKTD